LSETAAATPFSNLIDTLFTRINTASGPYQMVAVLGDGIVFECTTGKSVSAVYMEEVPVPYFNMKHGAHCSNMIRHSRGCYFDRTPAFSPFSRG
jgi:hypothetical protein